jgi:hypothetical protein
MPFAAIEAFIGLQHKADVLPFRQLQTGKGVGDDAYNGMIDCFRKIIKNEGCAFPLHKSY